MYLWLPYHPIYPYMLYLPIPNLSISCPLSISLSIYLSIYPSIHPSIYPSIHLSIFLFVCLSIDLSINLSIYQSIYLYLRNWKYVYINIYLPRSLSIHLFYLFYRIHRNYQIYPFFRFFLSVPKWHLRTILAVHQHIPTCWASNCAWCNAQKLLWGRTTGPKCLAVDRLVRRWVPGATSV